MNPAAPVMKILMINSSRSTTASGRSGNSRARQWLSVAMTGVLMPLRSVCPDPGCRVGYLR